MFSITPRYFTICAEGGRVLRLFQMLANEMENSQQNRDVVWIENNLNCSILFCRRYNFERLYRDSQWTVCTVCAQLFPKLETEISNVVHTFVGKCVSPEVSRFCVSTSSRSGKRSIWCLPTATLRIRLVWTRQQRASHTRHIWNKRPCIVLGPNRPFVRVNISKSSAWERP